MYGSVNGVADIASTWTNNGQFLDADLIYSIPATNPPLATVESWLETMSAYMDAALKDNYFETPIPGPVYPAIVSAYPVSYAAVNQQVNTLVADLVAARNQAGRFFLQTSEQARDLTNWAKIQKELIDWVRSNVESFLAEGVPQITTNAIRANQPAVILLDSEFDE